MIGTATHSQLRGVEFFPFPDLDLGRYLVAGIGAPSVRNLCWTLPADGWSILSEYNPPDARDSKRDYCTQPSEPNVASSRPLTPLWNGVTH